MVINTMLADRGNANILAILGVAIAVAVGLSQTTISLTEIWQDDGYRHCFLVPLISIYLMWDSREELAACEFSSSYLGGMVLTGLVLVWFVAEYALVQVVEHFAAVAILIATVWTVLGTNLLRAAAFPLGFLFFAVPFGEELIPWLMDVTATWSTSLLTNMGYTLFREGYYIYLPNGVFEVAEACAGLKYLYAGVMISTVLAYISFPSNVARISFVIASSAFYIFLNVVRATVVIMVASASDMSLFVGDDHLWFGWFLFGGALVLQIAVADHIRQRFFPSTKA